jgi:hypothetical protein
MFSKISRYWKVPDAVMNDTAGRSVVSKTIRLRPDVRGTFFHTIAAGDRLDHLAYKYYKEPTGWWRICDANPEFRSPQALIGQEPAVTTYFPLVFRGEGLPPWCDLRNSLMELVGVEQVAIVDDIYLVPTDMEFAGEEVTVESERFERALIITYNRMNIDAKALLEAMASAGFTAGDPNEVGRTGKKILIPPKD